MSKHIFNKLLDLLDERTISEIHPSTTFGSWYIELGKLRLVFEGRDNDLRLATFDLISSM